MIFNSPISCLRPFIRIAAVVIQWPRLAPDLLGCRSVRSVVLELEILSFQELYWWIDYVLLSPAESLQSKTNSVTSYYDTWRHSWSGELSYLKVGQLTWSKTTSRFVTWRHRIWFALKSGSADLVGCDLIHHTLEKLNLFVIAQNYGKNGSSLLIVPSKPRPRT